MMMSPSSKPSLETWAVFWHLTDDDYISGIQWQLVWSVERDDFSKIRS